VKVGMLEMFGKLVLRGRFNGGYTDDTVEGSSFQCGVCDLFGAIQGTVSGPLLLDIQSIQAIDHE
jgi:hypothetical protein